MAKVSSVALSFSSRAFSFSSRIMTCSSAALTLSSAALSMVSVELFLMAPVIALSASVPNVLLIASLIASSMLAYELAVAHMCLTWELTWRWGTTVVVVYRVVLEWTTSNMANFISGVGRCEGLGR